MLWETLRAYDSINAKGDLSYLYKFCMCCLYVLQAPFTAYDAFRVKKRYIAYCYWQIANVANTLNKLYDPGPLGKPYDNRIYLSQSSSVYLLAPNIDEGDSRIFARPLDYNSPIVYASGVLHDTDQQAYAPNIDDFAIAGGIVLIHVPSTIYYDTALMSEMTADVEQIRIRPIQYQIVYP